MTNLISLAYYKAVKGITDNSKDVQFIALIGMVSGVIQDYCHRVFGVDDFIEKKEGVVDNMGRFVFSVINKPIVSIDAITIKYIGVPTLLSVDVTTLDIMNESGYAYSYVYNLLSGVVLRDEYLQNFVYTIEYEGGIAVPAGVQLAAIQMVSDTFEYLYRSTTPSLISGTGGTGEIRSVTIGSYSESYDSTSSVFLQMADKSMGVVLSPTAKSLLGPYVRSGQSF